MGDRWREEEAEKKQVNCLQRCKDREEAGGWARAMEAGVLSSSLDPCVQQAGATGKSPESDPAEPDAVFCNA